jgi:hypothetical protein
MLDDPVFIDMKLISDKKYRKLKPLQPVGNDLN